MLNNQSVETYDQVKGRLDEIVQAVSDEGLSLDDALDLYEEAVKLGMRASQLIEDQTLAASPDAEEADDEDNSAGQPAAD